jgi:hypothetical protein
MVKLKRKNNLAKGTKQKSKEWGSKLTLENKNKILIEGWNWKEKSL